MANYPQREGEADCRDFLRTGRCKYGASCKYHHPIGGAKTPNDPSEPPFPIRPNEPPCQYYLKHGTCKFGQTCKFHHPPHVLTGGGSGNTVYLSLGNVNLLAQPVGQKCVIINNNYDSNGVGTEYVHNPSLVQLLPQRPGETECIYFLRNGRCKYGASCKYHHPIDAYNQGACNFARSSSQRSEFSNLNVCRPTIEQSQFSDVMPVLDRSSGGAAPLFHQNHLRRKNSRVQEGAVATHVLYSGEGSVAIVPIDQGAVFQPRRGSDGSNGYRDEKIGREYPPRDNSPSLTSTTVASSCDSTLSSFDYIPSTSFQKLGKEHTSAQTIPRACVTQASSFARTSGIGASHSCPELFANPSTRTETNWNTSPEHVNARFESDILSESSSNASFSSSYQTSERHSEASSPEDFIDRNMPFECNNPPMFLHNNDVNADPSKHLDKFSNLARQSRHPKIDDGLSMMTSALLTMLDSPEEGDPSENNPIGKRSSQNSCPRTVHGTESADSTNLDLWSRKSSCFDTEVVKSSASFYDNSLCHGDSIFQSFSNTDKIRMSPNPLGSSSSIPNLKCNSHLLSTAPFLR